MSAKSKKCTSVTLFALTSMAKSQYVYDQQSNAWQLAHFNQPMYAIRGVKPRQPNNQLQSISIRLRNDENIQYKDTKRILENANVIQTLKQENQMMTALISDLYHSRKSNSGKINNEALSKLSDDMNARIDDLMKGIKSFEFENYVDAQAELEELKQKIDALTTRRDKDISPAVYQEKG